MSYIDRLKEEIARECEALAEAREPLHPAWITHRICSNHNPGLVDAGDDRDFWLWGGHRAVRDEVGQYIRRVYGAQSESRQDGQLHLPGYKHLQTHYIIDRESIEVGVPIHDLSDSEIEQIASTMRANARALNAHADELMRFKMGRKVTVSV